MSLCFLFYFFRFDIRGCAFSVFCFVLSLSFSGFFQEPNIGLLDFSTFYSLISDMVFFGISCVFLAAKRVVFMFGCF